jgi:predicted Rossmann fold flavoprotein
MNEYPMYDVIVIGGGASGMFAAIMAAKQGKSVVILEKNKSMGEKLKITGGGRCNITNAEPDLRTFLKFYGPAADFLYSPFSQFAQADTFTYFESRKLPLVVQARKRAFPHTEKSLDVFLTMKRHLDELGVLCKTGHAVKKIIRDGNRITGVETSQGLFRAKSYVLATGGMSHPETGSTGDGFNWLTELGHTVKAPTPTIVPLEVADEWVKALSGVSLSFMKITFFAEEREEKSDPERSRRVKKFSKTGKILFTHFGLSGPLILNLSSKVSDLLQAGVVTAAIDLFPDTNLGALEDRFIKLFDANKNKLLRTVFPEIAPEGTAKVLMDMMSDIDFETKVHSVTREDRKKMVHLMKALPITVTGLMGYDRAVVADGGVTLSEIDTKTMRSKVIKNLLVTGDLLHINRPSGGFSLQLCWTTGYVAGMHA